jgi:lipopolysaccharide export system protein LptA
MSGTVRPAPVLLSIGLGFLLSLAAAGFSPSSIAKAASTTTKDSKEVNVKGPTKKESKEKPINIEAAKLDYYDTEQKLVYTGDVVAIQGDVTLKTPLLVVFLTPKEPDAPKGPPASASQMRRWEASGPVTLISKDEIGTGDSGRFEKAENKFYLDGHVTLTQGDYITKGDHAVHDLDTGRSVVTGHVRSMFPPKNNDDSAKKDDTAKKDDDTARKPAKTSSKLETKPKSQPQ